MNFKNKIIFLILLLLIFYFIFNNSNFNNNIIIENLENTNKVKKKTKILQNKNNYKESDANDDMLTDYKVNDSLDNNIQQSVNIPVANCISDCVISFDDCSQSTKNVNGIHQFINEFSCKWSNLFKFNPDKVNNGYNEYCSKCKNINNIKFNKNKNIYEFTYNKKNIKLSEGYYMDKKGNVKKLPKEKNLPSLKDNQLLPQNELNLLSGDDSNNLNYDEDNNFNDNTNSKQNSELSNKIKGHISNVFNDYIDHMVNSSLSKRNVGSNLNTSSHYKMDYMNLNSSLNNLVDANSSNRLMNDNPYSRNEMCYNGKTGEEFVCPKPYDYKPSMNLN